MRSSNRAPSLRAVRSGWPSSASYRRLVDRADARDLNSLGASIWIREKSKLSVAREILFSFVPERRELVILTRPY